MMKFMPNWLAIHAESALSSRRIATQSDKDCNHLEASQIYNARKPFQRFANLKRVAAAAFVACSLSSCSDFLDILPMNDVVLENYWTEKADVESVVNSCYEALENSDVITRMGVWGELRSDNLVAGSAVPNEINEILKENLLPSNSMCNWSKFYQVINRCNIVCHYAPEVQKLDPSYSEAEMRANIAEVSAIRALCYFYLIRTFRDVPYTTEASIDDTQTYELPATPFNQVLDTLISDLESVKDDAVRRYSIEKVQNKNIVVPNENTSRITRSAIHALLADLYLWKGDWDQVIKYCDLVLDYKRELFKQLELQDQLNDVELFGTEEIPLLLEKEKGSNNCGYAFSKMFGSGNSFESIFELYFRQNAGQQNTWVNSYYGNQTNVMGRLTMAEFLVKEMSNGKNDVFTEKDCRFYESYTMSGSSQAIGKYTRTSTYFNTKDISRLTISESRRSDAYANWIIYRMSDVILMKAEALIYRNEGAADEVKANDYERAFALINTVSKRALNVTKDEQSKDTLVRTDYVGALATMEDLLMAERQREFLFEGKRWYDLVRASRRDNNTTKLQAYALQKYKQDRNVIKIKLTDPNYIYFPYAKSELKVNPQLQQNPAFNKGDESVLTK